MISKFWLFLIAIVIQHSVTAAPVKAPVSCPCDSEWDSSDYYTYTHQNTLPNLYPSDSLVCSVTNPYLGVESTEVSYSTLYTDPSLYLKYRIGAQFIKGDSGQTACYFIRYPYNPSFDFGIPDEFSFSIPLNKLKTDQYNACKQSLINRFSDICPQFKKF